MTPKYNRYEFRVMARYRKGNRPRMFMILSQALSLDDAKNDVRRQLAGWQIENIQLKSINLKW